MSSTIWVACGGAIGSVLRLWLGEALAALGYGASFPWATLIANVAGSALIGAVIGYVQAPGQILSTDAQRFLIVGLCGGFTTFSSFSLQNLQLLQEGHHARAALYVIVSLTSCLLAVWIGYLAARP